MRSSEMVCVIMTEKRLPELKKRLAYGSKNPAHRPYKEVVQITTMMVVVSDCERMSQPWNCDVPGSICYTFFVGFESIILLIYMSLISSEYCILRCRYGLKDYCKLLVYQGAL